jgi:hypothetical protein
MKTESLKTIKVKVKETFTGNVSSKGALEYFAKHDIPCKVLSQDQVEDVRICLIGKDMVLTLSLHSTGSDFNQEKITLFNSHLVVITERYGRYAVLLSDLPLLKNETS